MPETTIVQCPSCTANITVDGEVTPETSCGACGCPLHHSVTPVRCRACRQWNSIPRGASLAGYVCRFCRAPLRHAPDPYALPLTVKILMWAMIGVLGIIVITFVLSCL